MDKQNTKYTSMIGIETLDAGTIWITRTMNIVTDNMRVIDVPNLPSDSGRMKTNSDKIVNTTIG